jgi:hypothetical protein
MKWYLVNLAMLFTIPIIPTALDAIGWPPNEANLVILLGTLLGLGVFTRFMADREQGELLSAHSTLWLFFLSLGSAAFLYYGLTQ